MTLAMLWVLISHHKGLTLLLIVVIALVLIALIPLVKRLLRSINGDPRPCPDGRRQAAMYPAFSLRPPTSPVRYPTQIQSAQKK